MKMMALLSPPHPTPNCPPRERGIVAACHPRRGVATMMGLVALAVVASVVILFAQTITREKHSDALQFQNMQQKVMERDRDILEQQYELRSVSVDSTVDL